MRSKALWQFLALIVVFALVLSACQPKPAATPEATQAPEQPTPTPEVLTVAGVAGEQQVVIPEPVEGKTNVAFVYVGPIGDAGWTFAHNQGRVYLEQNMPSVHTAYLESIPEGADAERVIRALARKGFKIIFTTSFGFMDPTETVASEFPDVYFIHISGFKKNDKNFANLFGAMEDMKYLAGMIAGARAKADGKPVVGYIAPWPIPEVIRLGNALALGMRKTCPECTMKVRWIFTWFDPVKEREAAESLMADGADVVVTGADTPGPVQAASEKGLWGIAYDSDSACGTIPNCLTVPYWHWGPVYVEHVKQIEAGTWKPGDYYFDADSGGLGILGFMEGQTPNQGVPADVVPLVKEELDKMLKGEVTRFTLFTGPIKDNKGNVVVPEGVSLTQEDLEGLKGVPGRPDCTICMNWLAEGFDPAAEIPPMNP